MSYDLYMFAMEPGMDPEEALERLEEDVKANAVDPAAARRNRRIADAIRAADPRYEEVALSYDVIAEAEGASVEEAKARHRDIQLIAEGGLEINLYETQAAISFPYWDSLDPESLTADIERAATTIAGETGWRLYDPQLEEIIDPATDARTIHAAFGEGVEHLQRILDEDAANADRAPFWKRLFGRDQGT